MLQRHRCLLTAPRVRRVVLGLASLLLLLVAAAFSWLSWQREQADQLRTQQGLVEIGAQALDAYFLGLERDMAALGRQIMAAPDPRGIGPLLESFQRGNPDLNIAILTRPDGQILAASLKPQGGALPSLAETASFVDARKSLERGNSLVISRSFYGPLSGDWTTPLRYALRDRDGKLVYLLGVGLPLSKTLSFWKDAPIPPNAALALMRDDGFVVARHPAASGESAERLYSRPLIGALTQYLADNGYPRNGVALSDGSLGGEHTGSTLVFRRLAHYPLTFYFRNPRSNLIAAWWQDVWFDFLLLGLMFAGGAAIYWWSARRQARWDEERSQRIEDLETANQELASFTYAISHDLRAPLRAIDSYTALHMEELAARLPQADVHLLERVRENTMRMGKLIDGLLDFSRQSQVALNIRRVDIHALVLSVLREEMPAGSNIKVHLDAMPDRHGDPVLLRKVWKNLIANAVKYSARASWPRIEIGYEDGAYFVRDNGAGFDMAHAARLFGVFSRLHHDTEFDGTGVGLAIVRRIIERHGGHIWANGEPGKGAEFRFALVDQRS
ncbi:MAG: sensory box histidine kinase [Betaproteobacteria bacterium]|nr:sensory box histidine kinase [Betaproteobacteria bacterium]